MRLKRIAVAVSFLTVAVLACNPPTPVPTDAPPPAPSPTSTEQAAPGESPAPTEPSPTPELPPLPSLMPTTEPVVPTNTPGPTATPSPPPSAGPLDFPQPTEVDAWEPQAEGQNRVTIIIHIGGGAPPFTVHHDLDVWETWERDFPIVFNARGCGAMVHTITVESADGQTAVHPYWIPAPWCITPEP